MERRWPPRRHAIRRRTRPRHLRARSARGARDRRGHSVRRARSDRSSGSRRCRAVAGRSAVKATSGTRARDASTIAGKYSAAAVPLVQASATGAPPAVASPSAKKAELRSSRWTCRRIRSSRANARANGVEREPGETQASRTPRPIKASTRAVARERDVAAAHHATVCARTNPSAKSRPVAACTVAVPTSTGGGRAPVAARDAPAT